MTTALKGIPLLRTANMGDIITVNGGRQYEFVRLKRAYFIGKRDGAMYNVPVGSAIDIERAETTTQFDPSSLSEGDLFYILNSKQEPVIFRFKHMINLDKIKAENPYSGQGYTVAASLCIGNVREWMR